MKKQKKKTGKAPKNFAARRKAVKRLHHASETLRYGFFICYMSTLVFGVAAARAAWHQTGESAVDVGYSENYSTSDIPIAMEHSVEVFQETETVSESESESGETDATLAGS